jgi:hypothetical protein
VKIWLFALSMVVLALDVTVWAEDSKEVIATVLTWQNMALMGPGDERAHYISVIRASETIQHNIEYHGGEIVSKNILYRTDDEARFHLLDALGEVVKSWVPHYKSVGMVDGSSWRVVLHYADGTMKEFEGYGKTPPSADEIKELIFALAKFKARPKIF